MDLRYFWDFFGPRAQGTAQHFRKHLDEFLTGHGMDEVGVELGGEAAHWWVSCAPAAPQRELIERALRPKRIERVD